MIDCRKIVQDIVENHLTVKDAALKYDCSVSTIRKYIAALKNSLELSDINLYNEYIEWARESQKNGSVKGGIISKRKSSKTMDEILELYHLIVEHDYTLKQLEKMVGVPSSTLYDCFIKYLDNDKLLVLKDIFDEHRRNQRNDYENDNDGYFGFHEVGSEISNRVTRK